MEQGSSLVEQTMAHRILGVDVGSYSVKLALMETSLRRTKIVSVAELPVPDGGDGQQILGQELASGRWKADTVVAALGGEAAMVRYLSFPFMDPRKIAPIVGYEMEGQIPYELDEVVFDHVILERSNEDGQPSARVVVVAAEIGRAKAVVDWLRGVGLDPDPLTVEPLACGFLGGGGSDEGETGAVAVLDVGHRSTNLTILSGGRPMFIRTLSRGSGHVTEAIASRLRISIEDAERTKQVDGMVPLPGQDLDGPRGEVAGAILDALKLWNLGVRQTLSAVRSEFGQNLDRVVLCGSGSTLQGLPHHVAELFGVELSQVVRPNMEMLGGGGPQMALAVGLCHLAAEHRHDALNLRNGPLASASSHSLVREKGLVFATAAVVALGLLVANGWARLALLKKEENLLATHLRTQTEQVLDKPMTDPGRVLRKIRQLQRAKRRSEIPIPRSSAFAVLSEISRQTPPRNKVTLDVSRMNLKARKIVIKGTVGSASDVELFATALRKIKCFDKVEPSKTTEVGVGDEKKSSFTITISSSCM